MKEGGRAADIPGFYLSLSVGGAEVDAAPEDSSCRRAVTSPLSSPSPPSPLLHLLLILTIRPFLAVPERVLFYTTFWQKTHHTNAHFYIFTFRRL